jgi:mono/diheme cytochrome c family protein
MKVVGRVLLSIVALVIVTAGVVAIVSNQRLNRTYDIPSEVLALTIPNDAATIARGRHLAVISGCTDCHSKDLGGEVFLDIPPFLLVAPNLTRGTGGAGASFTNADFVRAIRHGVAPDGRAFVVMPAKNFNYLSDADLAAIIAYVKSVPPVDRQLPAESFRPLGRVLLVLNQFPPPPAAIIDHSAAHRARIQPAVTVEYGRYLANATGCTDCHRPDLTGGHVAGSPPSAPQAQNITPAGIGTWTDADFFRALRVGKRPDGTTLNTFMPWPAFSQMTDAEISAILRFVRSVPPKQNS